jgi:imidazolonepropionase-like amidohydrolase
MAYRIEGLVLPGAARQEVFVTDGRFTLAPVEGARTLIEDAVLLPGLVDTHAHLALASPAPEGAPSRERVLASGRLHRDAGVCLVREPGSPDHSSTDLGPSDGMPRTQTAGRFLAPPDRYFPGLARETGDDDLPEAAEQELNAGGGTWAKVIGDSPLGQPGLARTYSADALVETARRVHAAGGRLAIHCSLPDVIQDAIDAGFDSLEHASFLQPDQIADAVRAGVAWVPTLSIDGAIRGMCRALAFPEHVVRDVDARLDRQPGVLCEAADAGLLVLAGTDAGMGPHGMVSREVLLMREAGLPADVAVGAASWTARTWLGLPGIEEGAPADLVAYREDPREHPGALASPVLVLLDGEVVRDER